MGRPAGGQAGNAWLRARALCTPLPLVAHLDLCPAAHKFANHVVLHSAVDRKYSDGIAPPKSTHGFVRHLVDEIPVM